MQILKRGLMRQSLSSRFTRSPISPSTASPGSRTTGDNLSATKLLHGAWLWPESDERCAKFVFKRLPDLYTALEHVPGRGICVQAGGNCGVWPKHLAREFSTVYTFEPDPLNFRCLCANASDENVMKFNAAVGNARGCIDLDRSSNCGAHSVSGAGRIPMIRIDDLALPGCDFLQLDIEGHEFPALQGAEDTVRRYHPVVMIEDKALKRRAIERGQGDKASSQPSRFLMDRGYEIVAQMNCDFLYVYRGE